MAAVDLTVEPKERAHARVGTILRDKWRLDRLLGIGGGAAVYAATHRNGSRVAIKALHPELAIDQEIRARFKLEGYAANKVGHSGVAIVLDDDLAEDGTLFLVMELLEGETVEQRWQSANRRLEVAEVIGICDALLDVLAAAHDQRIVHRDLKPSNLFLTQAGVLKVLDFGIARMAEQPSGDGPITRTGWLIGTPGFMPPEQARGHAASIDARTDLWAVGATMYTLLSGRFLFEAETVNDQLMLAMTTQPTPVAQLDPSIPPALAAVIDGSLRYAREERYPDARTMQRALREAALSIDPEYRPPNLSSRNEVVPAPMVASLPEHAPPVRKSAHRGPLLGAAFVLMLLVAVVASWLPKRGTPHAPVEAAPVVAEPARPVVEPLPAPAPLPVPAAAPVVPAAAPPASRSAQLGPRRAATRAKAPAEPRRAEAKAPVEDDAGLLNRRH